MELKPGYKQTEIGVIPVAWDVKVIIDCAGYVDYRGRTPPKTADGRFLVTAKNVGAGSIDYEISKEYVAEYDYEIVMRRGKPQVGDVLITTEAPLGNVALVDREDVALAQRIIKYRTDRNVLDLTYFKYYLLSETFQRILNDNSSGSTAKGIKGSLLHKLPVVIPPLAEQHAIAAALSDVDGLITALDRLIAKKRDIKQAAMQELLTGKRRLPGFGGEWDVKSVLELADGRKELFDDGDWIETPFLTEEGVRLVQTGNIGVGNFIEKAARKYISFDSFKSLGCKEVRPGDILICRLAEPAGRACIVPDLGEERIITAVDVSIFRPLDSLADRCYLVNIFCTREWFYDVTERCGGTTRTRIARSELGKIKIKLPPLPEQHAIAGVLSDMDAEIAALEQKRDKTRLLKQGMMQELLTGKTRLIDNG